MNNENIRLIASSSDRWINCPGSARLEHGIPYETNKYSIEGNLAHELAAIRLNNLPPPVDIDKYLKHPGMLINVDKYVQYVKDIISDIDEKTVLIERKVDLSHVLHDVANARGVCDVLIVDDNIKILHIIDLKYGKGVKVEIENNPQLLLYALGAVNDLQFLYEMEKIIIHIVQPRMNNYQHQELTIEELEPWKTFFLEKSQAALAIDAPRIPSKKTCKFCKAKAICPEYQEFNKPFSIDEFDTLTTKQEN